MTKNNIADNTQDIKELDLDQCYIIGEHGEQVTFQQLTDFYRGTVEILSWCVNVSGQKSSIRQ